MNSALSSLMSIIFRLLQTPGFTTIKMQILMGSRVLSLVLIGSSYSMAVILSMERSKCSMRNGPMALSAAYQFWQVRIVPTHHGTHGRSLTWRIEKVDLIIVEAAYSRRRNQIIGPERRIRIEVGISLREVSAWPEGREDQIQELTLIVLNRIDLR